MAEEIINALAKIQSLRVASRSSSFAFKGKNEDVRRIGDNLKVSTVLEGSVRKMGKKLRITAQLINVVDGYQLWSERYERELEDVFEIQDDISQAIVKALRVILSEGERQQIVKDRAVNVEAYEFYLRGKQYFHQSRRKSLDHARQMFDRAIEIDPGYALAYAGVADCYSMLYASFDAREFNLRQADAASLKALELDPGLAEAHVARGMAVSLSKRFDEAVPQFEEALRINPNRFETMFCYARTQLSQGKYEDAVRLFERATRLRPEDYETQKFLSQALRSLGRDADADAAAQKASQLIDRHLQLHPFDARALILAAASNAAVGDDDVALDYAARALAVDPEDPLLLYNVACTYAVLGRTDEALQTLSQSVNNGWGDRAWLEHDSDLDSLRAEPRYQALVKAM
jgi:tetratricopeptide (TPR) repeat protein